MALQFSTDVRNARLNAIETTIGASPILEIRTDAAPANCAAADTGTLLASMALPSDFMAAAASGQKALAGSWADASANASGIAAHFRIKDNGGTTCHLQGTVSESGGGGDLILDNTDINAGQAVSVTAFTITDGNA